jgi:hypothetical protein
LTVTEQRQRERLCEGIWESIVAELKEVEEVEEVEKEVCNEL